MKKINFNGDWQFVEGYVPSIKALQMYGKEARKIQLPHDAMIHEKRKKDTKNAGATGFYPGGIYTYFKNFELDDLWKDKELILEFEGVYEKASVYLNGSLVTTNNHGYSNFYADLTRYIKKDEINELKVVADNSSEENSRWYSGSGIYRNVNLFVGDSIHIPIDGVRVRTKLAEDDLAVVELVTEIINKSDSKEKLELVSTLSDGNNSYEECTHLTAYMDSAYKINQEITIPAPRLWDCDTPFLYDVRVELRQGELLIDSWSMNFGIRNVTIDAINGLRINGKRIKLRGTCLHHDNGVIGAATFADAEERKCRLIKDAGFNSVRSAHNPISKAFLCACDKYGILIMDELTDMWTVHKNKHDFASQFVHEWTSIVEKMVKKDYNHASVIMYSVGNEIQEIGTESGAELNRKLCNKCKELDPYRYTTNGMNALNAAGARIYPIMKELAPVVQKQAQDTSTNDSTGSNAINSFMKLMEGEAGDIFAKHPIITDVLAESSEGMDVIGLNYLTGRHLLEKELHPNKCVVGTETFPADIVRLWDIVLKSPHVLGDFTWTGLDYLGEAGCGIFYYDDKTNFGSHYPDRTAYIGDMNLIGYRRPISYLREIVYGIRKEPYIAVERVDKYGKKCSSTPWMFKDNIASWTWPGYESQPAIVDVYSPSEEVELFLNGRSLGKKSAGRKHSFTATFEIEYEPGQLEAIAYDNDIEISRCVLNTAGEAVSMHVDSDKMSIQAGEETLAFVTASLIDSKGYENMYEEKPVKVTIEGPGVLQGYGSGAPCGLESYDDDSWPTFDGQVMAVIRSTGETGNIKVTFEADGCEKAYILLKSEKR